MMFWLMYLLGNYEIIIIIIQCIYRKGKKRKRLDNKRTSNTRHDLQKRGEKMKETKKGKGYIDNKIPKSYECTS